MKIARRGRRMRDGDRFHARGFHVNDIIDVLERSFDQDTMLAWVLGRLDEFEEELLRTRSRGLKVFRDAARKRRKE